MTKDEFMSTPQYLDKFDIMKKYDCGRDRAEAILRAIKSVSDRAGLKGKVTLSDYEAWYRKIDI